ncbi:cyclic nucleotide-binding domain-containing protein 2-like [Elysia marginata]|uniref:Cyclic nucleotide-binding domain-containing protein 2-like n=1 Tax=Elysia marginata TaxID=1093978 RepID=A0AAV4HWC6_9GAST|nr:cyclic nucleotide-binding domain-containing protein 2-like [Elysia marginata]
MFLRLWKFTAAHDAAVTVVGKISQDRLLFPHMDQAYPAMYSTLQAKCGQLIKFGLLKEILSYLPLSPPYLYDASSLARTRGQYQSVMQVMDEYGAKISFRGQTFSRKDFRANDQHSLSRGARRLLQQDPHTRTDREIDLLLVALRHIPAFAEYPRKMQWRLCQVGRFEAYEPRRVVLKEGDVPTSFYFILSGTVIVTAFEEATQTSRTLVSLNKGMSFGELAVISNTRRQGTVCTRTDVQLLSITGQNGQGVSSSVRLSVLMSRVVGAPPSEMVIVCSLSAVPTLDGARRLTFRLPLP